MGWIIAAVIILLLAVLPLGVSIRYDSGGPAASVVAGPLRIPVYPVKKDPDKPPKQKKEKPQKEKAKTSGGKAKPGGSVTDFLPFVTLVLEFLIDFRHKIRVDILELKLVLAGGDPADLAINYGKAWAALGNLWPRLETWFIIKKRDVEVECDFVGSQTSVTARLDLSITLGRLLALVCRYGFRSMKEFLNFRKKRKGGTT